MAYDVTALPAYVQENRLPLLAAAVLKGKTVEVINRQSGVKGKAALNIVDINAPLKAGNTCGFSANGNDAFSQRVIETFLVKVEKEWCWKDLIGYWNEYEYRVVAGDKTLAFEEFFLTEIAKKIAEQIERILWFGETNIGITGFYGHLGSAVINAHKCAGNGPLADIMEAYNLIPEAVLDKAVIFVSPSRFRGAVGELVMGNLYHYNPETPTDEFTIPGTNTRVIKANGIQSTDQYTGGNTPVTDPIVCADPMNLVYGYDIEDSDKNFDVWYSRDNDTIRFRMTTNIGTQIAFPSEVVIAGD